MVIFEKINKIELSLMIACLAIVVAFPPIGVLIGFAIVMVYLLVGKDRKENLKSIGFTVPENGWLRPVLLCLLYGILIELNFQIIINPIIERLSSSEINLTAYDAMRGNFINYIVVLIIGWVVGGFIEEILFRGFLVTRISKLFRNSNFGEWLAILLTSFIFGFSHLYQGPSGAISTGLISIILGIIFIKHQRILWYSILTHGFINTVALTFMWLNIDKTLGKLLF